FTPGARSQEQVPGPIPSRFWSFSLSTVQVGDGAGDWSVARPAPRWLSSPRPKTALASAGCWHTMLASDALVHQTALLKNMTEISLEKKKLVVEMKGWDKLWALKSRLEIPLEHIKAVRADAEIAKAPKGIRMPGTHVP